MSESLDLMPRTRRGWVVLVVIAVGLEARGGVNGWGWDAALESGRPGPAHEAAPGENDAHAT